MARVRRLGWLAGSLMVPVLITACGPQNSSDASCVSPYLDDQPPTGDILPAPARTISPGDTLTVYGHWYTSTCNDSGEEDPLMPLQPVHLVLELPRGSVKPLGTFTPNGEDMGFSTTVHVPAGTPPGTARVTDDRDIPATYEFDVRR